MITLATILFPIYYKNKESSNNQLQVLRMHLVYVAELRKELTF